MALLFDGSAFTRLDRTRSPITGLGRGHWIAVADHLLASSEPLQGPSPWLYHYPGGRSINGRDMDGLEGFARTLLLGSFRLASGVNSDSVWSGQLQTGLAAGAEALMKNTFGAWPDIDPHSQTLVEAASIASALAISRENFWDPLELREQDAIARWLSGALVRQKHLNNWVLFPAVIAAALRSLGIETPETATTLATLPSVLKGWSLSHGWFSDGPGTRIDYYNAWAFHYYLPLIAHFSHDPTIARLAATRIDEFLATFPLFFSPTGAPVYFGRSLTYRFGNVAPMWTAQLIGAQTVDPGVLRATASRVLRYFAENGAMAQGPLSVGWHDENTALAQDYTSAASPLWSAKSFVGLLLGAQHPAWDAREVEFASSHRTAGLRLAEAAGFVVNNSTTSGIATLHLAGVSKWPSWSPQSRSHDPLYDRMAYSSITAPYSGDDVPENSVMVSTQTVTTRPAAAHAVATGENWIAARCRLWGTSHRRFPPTYRWGKVTRWAERLFAPEPWRRASLSTLTVLRGDWEIRFYRVSGTPADVDIRIGWYAISGAETVRAENSTHDVLLRGNDSAEEVRLLSPGWTLAPQHRTDPANPFGHNLTIPVATMRSTRGVDVILGAAIRLSNHGAATRGSPGLEWRQSERELHVTDTSSGDWFTVALGHRLLLPTRWNPTQTGSEIP